MHKVSGVTSCVSKVKSYFYAVQKLHLSQPLNEHVYNCTIMALAQWANSFLECKAIYFPSCDAMMNQRLSIGCWKYDRVGNVALTCHSHEKITKMVWQCQPTFGKECNYTKVVWLWWFKPRYLFLMRVCHDQFRVVLPEYLLVSWHIYL